MLSWWQEERMAKEYHQNLLRESEARRLYRQVRAAQGKKRARFGRRALAWLGGQMVHWGQGLQKRYAEQMQVSCGLHAYQRGGSQK